MRVCPFIRVVGQALVVFRITSRVSHLERFGPFKTCVTPGVEERKATMPIRSYVAILCPHL